MNIYSQTTFEAMISRVKVGQAKMMDLPCSID